MAGASVNNNDAHMYQANSMRGATSSSHTFASKESIVRSGDSLESDTTTRAVAYMHVPSGGKGNGVQHNVGATAMATAASSIRTEGASENINDGNVSDSGLAVARGAPLGRHTTTAATDGDRPVQNAAANNGVVSGGLSSALSMSGNAVDERAYADRFGNYGDYLSIVGDSVSADSSQNSDIEEEKQSSDNDSHRLPQQQQRQQQQYCPPPLPPLRSTYKSEPVIPVMKQLPRTAAVAKDVSNRNSYSRTLENALFYSQAVEQIRELDIADASNPYAVAMPRARPGKENIRQRRARNVTASREVFSIVNTGASFMPASEPLPPIPDARLVIERSRAMRSEPSFKAAGMMDSGSGGSVPIAKLLPQQSLLRQPEQVIDTGDSPVCGDSWQDANETYQPRRAGFDQPEPLTDGRAESVKQRGATLTPHTFSSSLRETRTPHAHNVAMSDILGPETGGGGDRDSSIVSSPQTTSRTHRHRQSVVSYFSTKSAAPPQQPGGMLELLGGVERLQKQDYIRPQTAVSGKRHKQQQQQQGQKGQPRQLSSHSKKVATRLLMRAGLSSIAIRVARIGHGHAQASSKHSKREEHARSESFDAVSVNGVDLDPNGLQGLRAERRKQVTRIDEYGFMEFEGDDARESEHAQQYRAWRAQKAGKSAAHRLERQLQMESAELHAGSAAKWETLLASFDRATLRGSRRVKRLVQAGVPQAMRGRFYYVLSGASALERRGEYARLLGLAELSIFDVIERDVARCYPDHVMFVEADGSGQRQLRRVLRAYAQHNGEIGYCQGMGRLVGLFLMAGLSEEHAFWVLVAVIQNYIPHFYEADLGGLRIHTAAFETMLQERNPRLHAHLAEQGCEALMYATPWFMTVFTLSLPWAAALRVWDWFVFRGPKVLFRAALAVTDLASAYLLDACPTIAELLGFLLHIPRGLVEADLLVAAAMRVKLSERHIARLTQEASTTTL
ncbi:hypothetical protein EV175_002478 [Coemansia sp. RSA 1933]|nr:hypothetical protein EV175_002478 [Coemansia sp. RSA 1933]